jgi:hypothetical protein
VDLRKCFCLQQKVKKGRVGPGVQTGHMADRIDRTDT